MILNVFVIFDIIIVITITIVHFIISINLPGPQTLSQLRSRVYKVKVLNQLKAPKIHPEREKTHP